MQSFASLGSVVGISLSIGAFLLFAPSSTLPAAAATTDPILEIHADGLTTYQYSGNTLIQGIRPRAGQRGVNLDGSFRAAPWTLALMSAAAGFSFRILA